MLPDTSPELLMIYDLRDPDTRRLAHRHRGFWGILHTDIYTLDLDHIALAFRPAGERWRPWERVRLQWILEDGEAA